MDPIIQAIFAATGGFFVISLIFCIAFTFCNSKKRHHRHHHPSHSHQNRTRTVPSSSLTSVVVTESATFDPNLHHISLPKLLKATDNFSPDLIIGDGSFGLVYKATLCNGTNVAVKKLSPDAFQGVREFQAEMETLGKIQHPNIVKILGFYKEGSDRVLVYEFIEKGSLDQWLCDTSSSENDNMSTSLPRAPLSWETRISIIKDVAQGLCYMHNLETPIIHRDIKASNVLLDSKFGAHIADFGLARRIENSRNHVSTQVAGTMGYMPPEYISGAAMATTMGDVYSFGILMLEIGTGRRPNWPVKEDGMDIGLIDWATKMVEGGKQMKMMDPNISRVGLKEDQVVEFFRIATVCTREDHKQRPTMKEVVDMLQGVLVQINVVKD